MKAAMRKQRTIIAPESCFVRTTVCEDVAHSERAPAIVRVKSIATD